MNCKKLFRLLLVLVMLVGATSMSAAFRDFAVVLNNGTGTLLTAEEQVQGTVVNFGITVAEDGTVTRVAADAEGIAAVIDGKFHSEHGLNNFVATVPVDGPVKITLGQCSYGGDVTVVNAVGETVATFTTKGTDCYKNSADNLVSAFYAGTEATTLTISGGKYVPYFAVEATDVSEIPTDITVTYLAGGAAGIVPTAQTVAVDGTFTIPANTGLYVEGKTLTGWTDGTKTYAVGEEVTVADANIELTPVFTENTVTLADRTEAVTINYAIITAKGAPSIHFEGNTGFLVAQAVVNGTAIDVKMDVDATNGKFKTNGDSWVQINTGTKLTIPSCKGAVVAITAYGNLDATTIEGVALNSGSKSVEYTCTGKAETVDIVAGENTYFSAVSVTLPLVEAEPESNFRDFSAEFISEGLLTADELVQGTAVHFGIVVAEDGTVSRVAADAENVAAVVKGTYHSNHGIGNATVTVPVDGIVKIGLGNCQYGKAVTATDTEGNVVTIDNTANCYHQDVTANISYGYYAIDAATTLTISAQYLNYISVEAAELSDIPVSPAEITVTYLAGEATGIVPAAQKVDINGAFTVPANSSLYVEGKTLTGWTDGTATYAVGEEVTVADADIELTPVFTENTVTLADRADAVTLTYQFGEANGAPTYGWQSSKGIGLLVAQATINGETIDVKLDVDATNGKLSNSGRGDKWAQANTGTIITVPSCKGATITLESYDVLNATTVDGVALESGSTNPSFTCAGTAETVDIVMGENTYLSYVKVVLPVVQADVQIQERGIIMTDFTDWTAVPAEGGVLDIATNFSNETIAFTFDGVSVQPNGQNTGKFGDLTGFAMAEKNAAGTIVTTAFNNITRVRYFHGATGSNRGYKLEKKSAADADWVVLSDDVANPQTGVWVECAINEEDVQLRWTNLNLPQNAYMFELEIYANVEITAEQVTLGLAASPEEGGSVSVYPVSEQYDINTEVTLTAKENFGYDFVNWTDANGNVIGETAECNYVVAESTVVTANFVAVNTYELVVNVEGGAKDYMVAITPEPTEVDDKLMFEEGTVVTLTAGNNPILTFSNWASGETANTIALTMDADQEVTAVYGAVDYLVGWDFIKSGKNSRAADFVSSTDNENTVLVLRNAEGTVSGWLDKSQEAAGGYEGKPAAVNWQQLTDKYYYQTKVNALNFTDIKVQSEMLYNFIAYEVQVLEYSLNGETWVEAGRVTLPAAKAWTPFEVTLPAECNNAAELYVRWIPDYTSTVVGSEGKGNDGTAITNIFITGKAAIYDDGVAPRVVSTVPVSGATGASASGRVVLNFDENVQVVEGTVATLGDVKIAPVVSGRTLTFDYLGLAYNTQYTFTLPANTVSDLAGNTLTEAVTLSFTTMAPPTVEAGMYDVFVTTADELLAALGAADGTTRFRIFLHQGTYDLGEKCLTNVKSNISLIGEDMENTIIVNKAPTEGIGVSATLLLTGENIYMQDLTIKNAYDYIGATGRAVCIQDKGNKNIFKNVRMLSYQDTYYTNNSAMRSYHEDTEIHGTVDFICGGGDVFFNRSTLYLEERSSANCITAPNGDTDWGYVFSDCIIDGHEVNNGQYNLGRPWNGTPRCVWLNTTMKVLPSAAGWTSMQVLPELFAEYNSRTESGIEVDLSGRTTTFTVNNESVTATYNPVLTAEEAAQYTITNVLAGDDQWQPNMLTEQAIAPVVAVSNGAVVWEVSDYVFCYAVCRNDKVVAFTNEGRYDIPADATAEDFFSVRAANEMGGLGVASVGINNEGTFSGVNENTTLGAELVDTAIYTIDGMLVPELQDGINIVRKTYSNGVVTVEKMVYRKY